MICIIDIPYGNCTGDSRESDCTALHHLRLFQKTVQRNEGILMRLITGYIVIQLAE